MLVLLTIILLVGIYLYRKILKQQSDFIAITAHEFMTPLSIALFQSEELLTIPQNATIHLENLQKINSSLTSLKHLTEQLFIEKQHDLKKLNPYFVNLNLEIFLFEIYKVFKPIMHAKQIKFIFKNSSEEKLFCKIDSKYFQQVIHNLLNNAYKFTPRYGKIILETSLQNKNILIQIKDTGIGIKVANQKIIFKKFRTINSEKRSGLGLGLYLSKKIIEIHQGKIYFQNNPGGGSIFLISLPLV